MGGETASGSSQQLAMKKRRRKFKKGKKASAEEAPGTPALAPLCRSRHKMDKRTTNPRRYTNQACCDVCGAEKLAKKQPFFFHCSFCRWDICPKCAAKPQGGEGREDNPRKRKRSDAEGDD